MMDKEFASVNTKNLQPWEVHATFSRFREADIAQLAEQTLRKRQVVGSSPTVGSRGGGALVRAINHQTTEGGRLIWKASEELSTTRLES